MEKACVFRKQFLMFHVTTLNWLIKISLNILTHFSLLILLHFNDIEVNGNFVHIVDCCIYDLGDNKSRVNFTANKLIIASNILQCLSVADLKTSIKVITRDIIIDIAIMIFIKYNCIM